MKYLEYIQAYGRSFCDFFLDLRYGGYFGGKIKSHYAHLGARETQSSNYSVLSCIFDGYKVKDSDVLVEVGCGKGRVINWWLRRGFRNRIVGVEIDEHIAQETRKRFEKCGNVEIICGNALEMIPQDGTIFYYYNSFDRGATREYKDRLKKMFLDTGGVTIFYANCEHLDVFSGDLDWKIYTNAAAFFKNAKDLWEKLDLPSTYPIAVIELRPMQR